MSQTASATESGGHGGALTAAEGSAEGTPANQNAALPAHLGVVHPGAPRVRVPIVTADSDSSDDGEDDGGEVGDSEDGDAQDGNAEDTGEHDEREESSHQVPGVSEQRSGSEHTTVNLPHKSPLQPALKDTQGT